MRWVVTVVLGVHALIHLMGFAKAFGYAELPQLTQPISRARGVAWLLAAGLVGAAAMMFAAGSRYTWMAAGIAAAVSQTVIVSSWRDAWAGTIANLMLLALAVLAWTGRGGGGAP